MVPRKKLKQCLCKVLKGKQRVFCNFLKWPIEHRQESITHHGEKFIMDSFSDLKVPSWSLDVSQMLVYCDWKIFRRMIFPSENLSYRCDCWQL